MARHPLRMTIPEVARDMRQEGFPISERFLAEGIETGEYPFGRVLRTGPTGRRTFLINRRDYENWKNENMRRL